MKEVNHIKFIQLGLNDLMESVKNCIPYFREKKIKELTRYLKMEESLFNNLTIRQLEDYIEEASKYVSNSETYLVSDLTEAYSYNVILERIIYLLNINLYTKLNHCVPENKALFNALKQRYFIINNFEYELRTIFFNLLNNHIEASDKMGNNYLFVLNSLKINLNTKYVINTSNPFKEHIKDIKRYDYEYFINEYLDKCIITILEMLSCLTDEQLQNESAYAVAISYQILLRSLFIILDDYKRLADYEEYYLNIINNNTIAKGIIKSAFISNYHDLQQYNLKKTKEN